MLLEARDYHNRHNTLDTLDPNRDSSAVDSVLACLLLAHAELGSEILLISLELAVQQPCTASPPQHAVALSLDPGLIIRQGTGADSRLKQDLPAVGESYGDQSGLLRREGK